MYINKIMLIRAGLCIAALLCALTGWAEEPTASNWKVRAVTSGPKHHFFGYYSVSPWNGSGKYMVCLESDFQDRLPKPEDTVRICLIDTATGQVKYIARTGAWNLQQGAMMHWDPKQPETHLLYNDRKDDQVIAVCLNVVTGERRTYDRAISAVSPDGRYALSLNYGRLQQLRRVVGYPGITDATRKDHAPKDDGIFLLDLVTGKSRLVLTHREIYPRILKVYPELKGAQVWYNHVLFNEDANRFFFLARAKGRGIKRKNAMFSANRDGSDLYEVVPWGLHVSHFDWRNTTEIVVTAKTHPDDVKRTHFLYTDKGGAPRRPLAPDFLKADGHCTFGPDGNWLVTDPHIQDEDSRDLLLYNVETDERITIGTFPLGAYAHGNMRCDLHPRWKATGNAICFDAIAADGTRQLHVAERLSSRGAEPRGDLGDTPGR